MTSSSWYPVVGSLVGLCIYACLSQTQKDNIAQKLWFRRGRQTSLPQNGTSHIAEHIKSNLPSRHGSGLPPSSKSPTLKDTLPPSQRPQLENLLPAISPPQRAILQKSLSSAPNEGSHQFHSSMVNIDENYRNVTESTHFPSGISVGEIRALGEFPDYAALSEVPLPEEYLSFNIDTALPRPYRPFRWGYFQTMSLSKLDPNFWLELENTYTSRIAERKQLYAEHGETILQALPGSEYACKELMQMVLQFLCARYPQYFSLSPSLAPDGPPTHLHNKILGTVTDLRSSEAGRPEECKEGKEALLVLLDNVPEDFAIMMRDEKTGEYLFRAGVICSSLGWNLGTKMGKTLGEIHGVVPDYKEKMSMSMNRFFSRLPSSKPIARGSWTFEIDQPLFALPPPTPSPSDTQPSLTSHKTAQDPNLDPSRIHLRVDWQTLRRLPLSGAIAFNYKALFTPISEFRDEPGVPGLVAHVLKNGNEKIMRYKNTRHVDHILVPLLEGWDADQRRDGLVTGDQEPSTLEDSPFFEGWEGKWHHQQGF